MQGDDVHVVSYGFAGRPSEWAQVEDWAVGTRSRRRKHGPLQAAPTPKAAERHSPI